jgi:hypothetical protein
MNGVFMEMSRSLIQFLTEDFLCKSTFDTKAQLNVFLYLNFKVKGETSRLSSHDVLYAKASAFGWCCGRIAIAGARCLIARSNGRRRVVRR